MEAWRQEYNRIKENAIEKARRNGKMKTEKVFILPRGDYFEVVISTKSKKAIAATLEHSFKNNVREDDIDLFSLSILTVNGKSHQEWCGEDRGPKRQRWLAQFFGK